MVSGHMAEIPEASGMGLRMNKRKAMREAHFAVSNMIQNARSEGYEFPAMSADENTAIWTAIGRLYDYHFRLASSTCACGSRRAS